MTTAPEHTDPVAAEQSVPAPAPVTAEFAAEDISRWATAQIARLNAYLSAHYHHELDGYTSTIDVVRRLLDELATRRRGELDVPGRLVEALAGDPANPDEPRRPGHTYRVAATLLAESIDAFTDTAENYFDLDVLVRAHAEFRAHLDVLRLFAAEGNQAALADSASAETEGQ